MCPFSDNVPQLSQNVARFLGPVSSGQKQAVSVLKSTTCSSHTFKDWGHPHPMPWCCQQQPHLRSPGVQGSLEHAPFLSCSVFRQEHRNFSSCVSVSYLEKISSVISLYHRASCCNKREEKSKRCDRCDLQRTEQKGAGEYNSFHPFSWIKGNNLLRHL